MIRVYLILFFCTFFSFSQAQTISLDTVYSSNVKDRFIIQVRKPIAYAANKKYHHVYITDGSLGIGNYVLGKSDTWKATVPSNCVIIAISHLGNWHEKRARDFIPADISKNQTINFGRAESFYWFLKYELLPFIEKKMPNKKDRVLIGHSFGGLFCLYTLFKKDPLFDQHFAISPSCWANQYELPKIEAFFATTNKTLKANVTLYVGGLEFLNKVLYSTRKFYTTAAERKYAGLRIRKIEIGNANHFSIRKPAIDQIFEQLKD